MNTLLKKHAQNLKENKKGFTLVELIIVLVIIAILAAIAIPSMLHYINQAKESVVMANARSAYNTVKVVATEKIAKDQPLPTSNEDWKKAITPYLDGDTASFTVVVTLTTDPDTLKDNPIAKVVYTEGTKEVTFEVGKDPAIAEVTTQANQ